MIKTAIIAAFFSLFLEYCMTLGNIFYRYNLWLTYWWIKWRKRKGLRMVLKPMGLCVYCFGSWVCLLIGLFYNKLAPLDCLLSLGFNYIIIASWKRIIEV